MAQNGKTYASKADHQNKYANFKGNYLKVQSHNSKLEKAFEMEINKFSDMSDEEFYL
jgi:hypothetical protein